MARDNTGIATLNVGSGGANGCVFDIDGNFSRVDTLYALKFVGLGTTNSPTAFYAVSEVTCNSRNVHEGIIYAYQVSTASTLVTTTKINIYIWADSYTYVNFTLRYNPNSTQMSYFNPSPTWSSTAPAVGTVGNSTTTLVHDTSQNATFYKYLNKTVFTGSISVGGFQVPVVLSGSTSVSKNANGVWPVSLGFPTSCSSVVICDGDPSTNTDNHTFKVIHFDATSFYFLVNPIPSNSTVIVNWIATGN